MEIEISSELTFQASRSSGKGGQNVNKVSSKIEVSFDVVNSHILTEDQKKIILAKLSTKLTNEGVLKVTSQEDRSQLVNKTKAIEKIHKLINKALVPVKKRKKTKPSKASKEKRIKTKKEKSEIKSMRKKIY